MLLGTGTAAEKVRGHACPILDCCLPNVGRRCMTRDEGEGSKEGRGGEEGSEQARGGCLTLTLT